MKVWQDGQGGNTPITAAELNRIEAALANALAGADVQAAANSYTDSKLGVGFNPTTVPNLLAWFAADNLAPGLFASDTFSRADASSLGTSSGGQAWTTDFGVIGISSKKARMLSGGSGRSLLPVGRCGDYAVVAKVKFAPTGTSDCQLVLRYSNGLNMITLNLSAGTGVNRAQTVSIVAGVTSQISLSSAPWGPGSTVMVTTECIGNVYYIYADRVLIGTHTDSGNNFTTTSRAGLGFGAAGAADTTTEVQRFFVAPIALTTLSDASPVSAWPNLVSMTDQSAAGASARPTYRIAAQNGLPAIRFSGSQSLASLVPADSAEFTMVAALKVGAAQQNSILASTGTGGVTWRINSTGKMEILKTNTSSIGVSTDAVPASQPVVVAVSYDATGTYTFYINGQPAGGGIVGSPPTFTAATMLALGSAPGNTEMFNGDMFEVVIYNRALYGRELQPVMTSLSAKWGVGIKQRILSATKTPLALTYKIKGSSVHPKNSDFSYGNGWIGVHGHWDWTWVKKNVDRAVSRGANTIRLIGDVETVFTGVITQATYLAQLGQLVDYLASINVKYYHCAGDATHFGGADDAYVVSFMAAQAALLATKTNVIAFEMLNEVYLGVTFYPESALVALVARISAAVRAAAPNIPLTVSSVAISSSIAQSLADGNRLRWYAPFVDFFDFHVYPTSGALLKPWHTAAYEVVCDRPIVFGEFGMSRSSHTGAEVTAVYEAVRQLAINSPRVAGVLQWAAIDDGYGLYTETGDTLQTDAATPWALFAN